MTTPAFVNLHDALGVPDPEQRVLRPWTTDADTWRVLDESVQELVRRSILISRDVAARFPLYDPPAAAPLKVRIPDDELVGVTDRLRQASEAARLDTPVNLAVLHVIRFAFEEVGLVRVHWSSELESGGAFWTARWELLEGLAAWRGARVVNLMPPIVPDLWRRAEGWLAANCDVAVPMTIAQTAEHEDGVMRF